MALSIALRTPGRALRSTLTSLALLAAMLVGGAPAALADPPVTSDAFTLDATHNAVTITLTGGTFKAGPLTTADFTFDGTSAAILGTGEVARTSSTVATITGISGLSGADNTVTVKPGTMDTTASSVSAVGSKIAVTSGLYALTAVHNAVTITLTGGTFKSGTISAGDFTFAGPSATTLAGGTFTRDSSTVVTISGISGLSGSTNTVTVKAATMVNGAASVTAAGTKVDVSTSAFTMTTGDTSVTVTLNGGTFKSGSIVAGDFTFTGTDQAALAAGTFSRTGDSIVTITGLSSLSGTNNVITVKAATMDHGAASVSAVAGKSPSTSAAYTLNATHNNVLISLSGGTFKASTITASDFLFSGTSAALLQAGTFTRTSSTLVTISNLSGLSGSDNVVTVLGRALATSATSVTAVGVRAAVTTPTFTMTTAYNTVTLTLTGGTFKSTISASDFTFDGSDAAALASGVFTRVSDTVVRISGLTGRNGSNNTVTVKADTMVNGAKSVAATLSKEDVVASAATFTTAHNAVTITLTGGSFKSSISASDFVISGTSAAILAAGVFTRTSNTVVTITGVTGLGGTNNVITVKAATMVDAAAYATVSGLKIDITSPTFSLVQANNAVVITLTGGTFKSAPVSAADFTFIGTDAAALATGTYTRTSDTVVTITGISGLVGVNNVVTVKADTMASGARSVAVTSTKVAVTSVAFALNPARTKVTVTLVGGTFKAAPITAADFIFSGTDAAAFAAATFTRVSDTVVTITGYSWLFGTDDVVTVKDTAMVLGAASVMAKATGPIPVMGTASGLKVISTSLAQIAFRVPFNSVPSTTAAKAPIAYMKWNTVRVPRVSGLPAWTSMQVRVRSGNTWVSLGRVKVYGSGAAALPGVKALKKGQYILQLVGPVGVPRYVRLVVV